jgi:excisionase family DNA binding protein
MQSQLLSAHQVRALLDVDTSTVYRMAADGRLPAVKVGRQWRFPADRITALLDGHHAGPTPSLATLVDATTADALIDVAADSLGVMMLVTDMEGVPLTGIANPCPRFRRLMSEPDALADCAAEWRRMAEDVDFAPAFHLTHHGFLCARSIVRAGTDLVGMVLAGGIAVPGDDADDVYQLTLEDKTRVQSVLPRVASVLSRIATEQRRLAGAGIEMRSTR